MSKDKLAAVSFEPADGRFTAYLPVEEFISNSRDPEPVLEKAVELYQRSLVDMRSIVAEIYTLRISRRLLPARTIWRLGNAIFTLVEQLESLSLQLDGIYSHLSRDLGVKRKWLEKVVIFRRYLPRQSAIPESLNWGRCEKGTRKVAEALQKGTFIA